MLIEIWAEHSEYGEPRFMGEAESWEAAGEMIEEMDDGETWPEGWDPIGLDRATGEFRLFAGEWEPLADFAWDIPPRL